MTKKGGLFGTKLLCCFLVSHGRLSLGLYEMYYEISAHGFLEPNHASVSSGFHVDL